MEYIVFFHLPLLGIVLFAVIPGICVLYKNIKIKRNIDYTIFLNKK